MTNTLMQRAQAGDAQAYRLVLETARVILKVYARRFLLRMGVADPAEAEDRVQEILLAVHQKRHTFDPSQPFEPWLFAIARYKLIDYGRQRKRRPEWRELDEETLATPVFEEAASRDDLEKLLSQLPERSREVLRMVKLEGLSVAEAAARSQMSESALKVLVHRTLKKLRKRSEAA